MSVNADLKCKFADLKYEQLLTEKYFIETCFSKKYSSYSSKQQLKDMWFEIKATNSEKVATTTVAAELDC